MKKRKINGLLLILVGCFSIISCTSERYIEPLSPKPPVEEEKNIPLELPVTKGTINGHYPIPADSIDYRVGTLRLMVIKNGVLRSNVFRNDLTIDSTTVTIHDSVPTGRVNYFLIANEDPLWGLDALNVDDPVHPSVLKDKVLSFGGSSGDKYPVESGAERIPMLRHFDNLDINAASKAFHNGVEVTDSLGKLSRLYAKVSLDLICDFDNLDNGGDPIELESISVKHMPKKSYLYPTVYTEGEFFDGGEGQTLAGNTYYDNVDSLVGHFTFYIPEHIVGDAMNKTYLSAIVRLKQAPTIKREYKIALGDSIVWNTVSNRNHNEYLMTQAGAHAVRISRNTHYILKAEIRSFDQTSGYDLKIVSKIIDWASGTTDDKEFWQYDLKVLPQDEFYISTGALPYTGVLTVETNHPDGWSVSGSLGVTFENAATGMFDLLTLTKQRGNKLKFQYNYGMDGTIDISAGPLVKQIKITTIP